MRRGAVFLTVNLLISVPVFAEDTTPPARPIVSDEGTYTTSLIQLHASWSSADPESGIAEYQYLIRRGSRYGTILVPWSSSGAATSIIQTDLKLLQGRTYYFWVKAKNGAGLWSSPGYSDGIRVDTTAPSASRRPTTNRVRAKHHAGRWRASRIADTIPPTGVISINSGSSYTTTRIVTLTLVATDDAGTVSQMQFSNEHLSYTAPEAYAPIKRWSLPPGDRGHTVYVRFRDAAGNWSEAASDTIMLDAVAPTVVIVYPKHGMLLGSS